MPKKIKKFNEAGWAIAMVLLTFGVCLMTKADFGVSMVVSPAYVIHIALSKIWSWYTFGTSEYIFQGVLLIVMCLIVRRFNWRYLLSFADAVLYGLILDMWFLILGRATFEGLAMRVAGYVAGLLLSGISVALFFRTYMPIEVYDLFVTETVERYSFNPLAVKWIYDLSMLALAIIITLVFNGGLIGIGWGTVVCAVINSPLISLSGKVFDRFFEFDPLFPGVHKAITGRAYGEAL